MPRSAILLALVLASCGNLDDLTTLSIRVHSPSSSADSLRRFPPNTPLPERIQVRVYQSRAGDTDMLKEPVKHVDEAWDDLEEDPTTQKKYLLVTVRSNAEKDYTYVLQLASLVANPVEEGDLYIDECGTIGNIQAEKGAKVRLDLHTHLDDCSRLPCGHDGHCIGERYCLSFECQSAGACTTSADCPEGAYCNDQGACDSSCTATDSRCTNDYTCCGGICSIHCPN